MRAHKSAPVPETPAVGATISQMREWPLWRHLSTLQHTQLAILLDPNSLVWKRARFGLSNLMEEETFTKAEPESQAKQVMAMLSVDPVLPGNTALAMADIEAMAPSYALVTAYELTPATRVANFAFRTKVADADKFALTLDGKLLPIYQPQDQVYSNDHQHTVTEVAAALASMPAQSRELLSEVRLSPDENRDNDSWAKEFHLPVFSAYMSIDSEAGALDIYPTKNASPVKLLRDNLGHEAGHVWSIRAWGRDDKAAAWEPWRKAIEADGLPVSGYGKSSPSEDVAEATVLFLMTRGTPRFADFKALYPNRFAILAKQFGES